jgi:[FeFe] hydrogenase H-cluster maturation GTPase HydF
MIEKDNAFNRAPQSERVHIALFGRRNVGKSSLINALTGQQIAIVSDMAGTTTDPVIKSMEILPLGPCVLIDTAGFDDTGKVGDLRTERTREVIKQTDIAILVTDGASLDDEAAWAGLLKQANVPYLAVLNKVDLMNEVPSTLLSDIAKRLGCDVMPVSAMKGTGLDLLRKTLAGLMPENGRQSLTGHLAQEGDTVLLVMPQDPQAPKGRLILPQVQMIRDILDEHGMSLCVQTEETATAIEILKEKPRLVITDSQVFKKVAEAVPEDIPLTSFSILLARYKGYLDSALKGVNALKTLKEGDKVLISEGCTHHRQCNDIGTVKIPKWLKEKLGFDVRFDTTSGTEFPDDFSAYKVVIHCGGCMLNEREITYRVKCAEDQGVPVVNYGILIAYLQGILDRAVKPLL